MNLSTRRFMMAAAGASGRYWYATLASAGANGEGVAVDSAGNVYLTGYYTASGSGTDLMIAKYTSNGFIEWQRRLGGSATDRGSSVGLDGTGNVYVVGWTASQGAGSDDILVGKYDSAGTIQWQRSIGGSGTDTGFGVAIDASGNVCVAGSTTSAGAGNNDAVIAKYNSSGVIQWRRLLGGSGSDIASGVAVDASGNIYVAGNTDSQTAGSSDVLIAKYNASGTIQWQRRIGGGSADLGRDIALDSSGNVYIVGESNSSGGSGNYDLRIK